MFTLCTLRNSNSDIAKKQEIGRGLRLPVDIKGKRITDEKLNVLTVIANDHYDHFADTLQKDFNDEMGFNRELRDTPPESIGRCWHSPQQD